MCKSPLNSLGYDLYSVLNQKHLKTLSSPQHLKLKKIEGLCEEKWNSRTFQGLCEPWYPYGGGVSPEPFSENNVSFMDVLGSLEILS